MTRRVIPHAPRAAFVDAVLALGEVVVDETTGWLFVGDGITPGGLAVSPDPEASIIRPEQFANGSAITDLELSRAVDLVQTEFAKQRPSVLVLPAREMVCSAGLTQIDRPISIMGQGWRQSIVKFTGTGQFITLVELGFGIGGEGPKDYPPQGDTSYINPSTFRAGFSLQNLTITGDRSKQQDGIVFEGNCDNARISGVKIDYFNGYGMFLGKPRPTYRGNVRESYFSDITIRRCGRQAGSMASLYVYRAASFPGDQADACNMLEFTNIQVVYHQGHGVHFHAPAGGDLASAPPINTIALRGVQTHAQLYAGDLGTNGDGIRIEGFITAISGDVTPSYHTNPNFHALRITHDGNRLPAGNLRAKFPSCVNAAKIDNVQQFELSMDRPSASGILVNLDDNNVGQVEINVHGDSLFLAPPTAITFNNAAAVPIEFAPKYAAGDLDFHIGAIGQSVRMNMDGALGTMARTGATTATFTPVDTLLGTSRYAPDQAIFSKVLVPFSKRPRVTGQWAGFSRRADMRGATFDDGRVRYSRDFRFLGNDAASKYVTMHTYAANGTFEIGTIGAGGYGTHMLIDPDAKTCRLNSDTVRFIDGTRLGRKVGVPANATAPGQPGDWAAGGGFFYSYLGDGATHSWQRVATAAW